MSGGGARGVPGRQPVRLWAVALAGVAGLAAGGVAFAQEPVLKKGPVLAFFAPDLVVTGAALSNTSPSPGETVTLKATIKNLGMGGLAGDISVSVKPNTGSPPAPVVTKNLSPGESRVVSVGYAVPSAASGRKVCFEVGVSSPSEPSSAAGNNNLSPPPCVNVQFPSALISKEHGAVLSTSRIPFRAEVKQAPADTTLKTLSPDGVVQAHPGSPSRAAFFPDVSISSVAMDPAGGGVMLPKGVLTFKATLGNSGMAEAEGVRLSLKAARKTGGKPDWRDVREFKMAVSPATADVRAGGTETLELELKTTPDSPPGEYLYQVFADLRNDRDPANNSYEGPFVVCARPIPPKAIEAFAEKKKIAVNQVKLPKGAIVLGKGIITPACAQAEAADPSRGQAQAPGQDAGDAYGSWDGYGGGDWGGSWGGDWGGDWGGGWGGDWGGDWGGSGDWGGAQTPPAGPTRTPGSVGEGSSRGMDLAELKPQAESQTEKFVPNRVVLFALPKGNESAEAILKAVASRYALSLVELTKLESAGAAMGVYKIVGRREVSEVVSRVQQDGRVAAQPNYYFEALGKELSAALQYAPVLMEVPRLKAKPTGKGVKVALLDTGFDPEHKDLAGRVAEYRDIVGGKSKPTADLHGTAMAGIVGGRANDAKGVAGIAPGASLIVIKVIEPKSAGSLEGTSTTDRIVKGLDAAVSSGARVINIPLGGPKDEIVGKVIDAALKKNVIVVAAGGNGGPRGRPLFPATHPGVIAVTAIDKTSRPYSGATPGDFISVSAPGVEVFSTAPGNKHQLVSGTSFAAAHVSSVAALLLEMKPTLTPQEMKSALESGAVDIGPPGKDPVTGHGRVSACGTAKAGLGSDPCGK